MTVLGSSDLDVFPLGLGGNTFGWASDKDTSFEVLDAYIAGGGNFIDTADSYSAWGPAAGRDAVPDADRPRGARGPRLGRRALASARTVDQLPALLASATLDLAADEIEVLDKASAA